jgi:hypothetical protein
VFGAGFFFMALFLSLSLACRASQLISWTRSSGLNIGMLAVACVALVCIILMGCISDSSDMGDIHLYAAGAGMALLAVYACMHSIACLVWRNTVDPECNTAVKVAGYCFTAVCSLISPVTFGIWFSGDKADATLEWVGVVVLMLGLSPFFYLFWAGRRSGGAGDALLLGGGDSSSNNNNNNNNGHAQQQQQQQQQQQYQQQPQQQQQQQYVQQQQQQQQQPQQQQQQYVQQQPQQQQPQRRPV